MNKIGQLVVLFIRTCACLRAQRLTDERLHVLSHLLFVDVTNSLRPVFRAYLRQFAAHG